MYLVFGQQHVLNTGEMDGMMTDGVVSTFHGFETVYSAYMYVIAGTMALLIASGCLNNIATS